MEIKLVSPQPKHALTHDSHFQMSHKSKSQTRSPPSGPCSSLPHTAGKTVALPEKKKSLNLQLRKLCSNPALPVAVITTLRRSGVCLCRPQSSVQKQKQKNPHHRQTGAQAIPCTRTWGHGVSGGCVLPLASTPDLTVSR